MNPPESSPLVLVLEDDAAAAEALALLIEDWGFTWVGGASFAEAAATLKGRFQDVRAIIADFHLSGGETGLQAVRQATERGGDAPVLLLTASLRRASWRHAQAAGYSCMEKPADPRRLKAWLDAAVGATGTN